MDIIFMLFLVLGLPILSIYLIIKGKGSYLRIIGIIGAIAFLVFITWFVWMSTIVVNPGFVD